MKAQNLSIILLILSLFGSGCLGYNASQEQSEITETPEPTLIVVPIGTPMPSSIMPIKESYITTLSPTITSIPLTQLQESIGPTTTPVNIKNALKKEESHIDLSQIDWTTIIGYIPWLIPLILFLLRYLGYIRIFRRKIFLIAQRGKKQGEAIKEGINLTSFILVLVLSPLVLVIQIPLLESIVLILSLILFIVFIALNDYVENQIINNKTRIVTFGNNSYYLYQFSFLIVPILIIINSLILINNLSLSSFIVLLFFILMFIQYDYQTSFLEKNVVTTITIFLNPIVNVNHIPQITGNCVSGILADETETEFILFFRKNRKNINFIIRKEHIISCKINTEDIKIRKKKLKSILIHDL
jgi:hypothetical protein